MKTITRCFCDLLQIFDDHKRCEIDPAKLREGESLDANLVSSFIKIFGLLPCNDLLILPAIKCLSSRKLSDVFKSNGFSLSFYRIRRQFMKNYSLRGARAYGRC